MEKLKKRNESTDRRGPASTSELADEGQRIYASQLKDKLEPQHTGEFVANDPEPGAYFLGGTGSEARPPEGGTTNAIESRGAYLLYFVGCPRMVVCLDNQGAD